ncbi:MAG: cytidine deaminase [Clostridiales bacterium 43-6]|nr:MAG: cytidine deaminase [Clostridiales bacterium 43-6]
MNYNELITAAIDAKLQSYSPYSMFAVGAALLTPGGTIYTGCNIENAAYTPTNCAERTAFFKAVSEGHREFTAIAIAGGYVDQDGESDYIYPCGVCRQVMSEFCSGDFVILSVKDEEHVQETTLKELLPHAFGMSL